MASMTNSHSVVHRRGLEDYMLETAMLKVFNDRASLGMHQ